MKNITLLTNASRRSCDARGAYIQYECHVAVPTGQVCELLMPAKPLGKCLSGPAINRSANQFETHPNSESLMADLDKNQKFNPFSETSKELFRSTGNTEYFEMCEITSKVQCQDCLLHCEIGIKDCTCGTCLRPPQKNRKLNKDCFDVLSIPNYVIKKGPSHGARHGPTESQRIYFKAHNTLRKEQKHGTKPYSTNS